MKHPPPLNMRVKFPGAEFCYYARDNAVRMFFFGVLVVVFGVLITKFASPSELIEKLLGFFYHISGRKAAG